MGWTKRDFAETFQRMLEERYREVGTAIKRARLQQGLSQEALAHRAEVSAKTVSRVEQGRHETRGGTYRKLAEALGLDVSELLAPLVLNPGARAELNGSGEPEDAAGRQRSDVRPPDLGGAPSTPPGRQQRDSDPAEDRRRASDGR